jgi:peptidoglycan-N-acetylglucosamine deacetylase
MRAQQQQIFHEPSGRRWRLARAIGALFVGLAVVLIGALIYDALTPPHLAAPQLTTNARSLRSAAPPHAIGEPPRAAIGAAKADAPRYAFYVNWDDNSFVALKRHARDLDVLAPEWLHLASATGAISADDPAKETRARTWIAANAPRLALTPLINNYDGAAQTWNGGWVGALVADAHARQRFVLSIVAALADHADRGLNLDFEQVPHTAMAGYAALVRELAIALHAQGRTLDVSVPADDDAYPFAALADCADHLVLMSYDEHTADNDPGPLASQGWFENTLDRRFATVPDDKLIVGIGSYGYDWRGPGHGDELTVQQAWQTAGDAHAPIAFDPNALTPTYAYQDEAGANHQVWFLDAASAFNQTAAALAMKPGGLALWRLGSEDPGVWSFFAHGRKPDAAALAQMGSINAGYDLVYQGDGEALKVTGEARLGARTFAQDPQGEIIVGEKVQSLRRRLH